MRREPGQLFFLTTQGCKVNQYESQAIREALVQDGLMETSDSSLADIVLINSCAVTERAVLDLAKLIRNFAAADPKP
jgi:tRNA A37 methylthiotransferase MiaB